MFISPSNRNHQHLRNKNNSDNRPRVQSARSFNLKRLIDALDLDLVSVALGVSEAGLQSIVTGRDSGDTYMPHIHERFEAIGLPANWLDRSEALLGVPMLNKLRGLAGGSEHRAPLRRNNFRQLAQAFESKMGVLADALEVIESTIINVVDGRFTLDDQRFGHLNPRLMLAGFPDGWLDQPKANLKPEWIQGLVTLATDDYESHFETQASAQNSGVALAFEAALATTPDTVKFVNLEVTPQNTEVAPLVVGLTSTGAECQVPVVFPSVIGDNVLQSEKLVNLHKEILMTNKPNPPSLGSSKGTSPPMFMSKSQSDTAVMPVGAKKAGRPVGSFGSKTLAAAKQYQQPEVPLFSPAAPIALNVPVIVKPARVFVRPQLPQLAPSTPLIVVDAIQSTTAVPVTQVASSTQPGVEEVEKNTRTYARADGLTKEQSQSRADALSQLLEQSRRGAKVCLWRDLMGASLPYWANIRRGAIRFRDDLAVSACTHLGLPEGWLDNPVFPPATLAAWVMDASVALPESANLTEVTTLATKALVSKAPPQYAADTTTQPSSVRTLVPLSKVLRRQEPIQVQHAMAPATLGSSRPIPARVSAVSPVSTVSTVSTVAPPPQSLVVANPVARVEVPVVSPAIAQVHTTGFAWVPSNSESVVGNPGTMTQALNHVLNRVSAEGRFTDDDAMRLMQYLLTQR